MKKIVSLLADASESFPCRFALKDNDNSITYKELYRYVTEMSEILKAAGCSAGVSVGLLFHNSIEYVIAFYAISKAGGTIVAIDPVGTDTEVENLIKRCNVSIVVHGKLIRGLKSLGVLQKSSILLNVSKDGIKVQGELSGKTSIDPDLNDVALLLGTSGSTGKSKFVMLTDENLIENINAYRQAMSFEGIQKVYCVLPMHHIYHITAQLIPHIARGDQLYIRRPPFKANSFLKMVQDEKITVTAFVPYMINILANVSGVSGYDLSSLQAVTISGARVSKSSLSKISCKLTSTRFLPTYGLTEGGSRVSIVRPEDINYPSQSVGHTLPGVQVKIDSKSDQFIGEILVKSKSVMKGYYKDKKTTSETVENGWLRTGDLGFLDESEYLHLIGRKKNLIISGGMNINPSEIEGFLKEHPEVAESAVLPMSHDLLDEVPFAFVESKVDDSKLLISELRRVCMKKLSLYKVPYKFVCKKELPRLSNSKIDYAKLSGWLNEIK